MKESAMRQRRAAERCWDFRWRGSDFDQSLLLSVAAAFFTFFASTCIAIFALLAWNQIGHHTVNYADTYLYVGLPLGVLVLVVALPYFGVLWIRAKARG
jgi:hypothetical protein